LPDDFERRSLLRNEQHRFAVREAVGDGVCDGLALAGAGRAKKHVVGAALGCDDGRDLR